MKRIVVICLAMVLIFLPTCSGNGNSDGEKLANFTSSHVSLIADNCYVVANEHTFYIDAATAIVISSPEPNDDNNCTLEVGWQDNSITYLTLIIYFKADTTHWWADEIRTCSGQDMADCIYYYGEFFKSSLGTAYTGEVDLESDATGDYQGSIHFENLSLEAFLTLPIENTIKGYMTTYNAEDFVQCLAYFTDYADEQDALDSLAFFKSLSGEIQLNDITNIDINTQRVDGMVTAYATISFTLAGGSDSQQIQLKKVSGEWKIVWYL